MLIISWKAKKYILYYIDQWKHEIPMKYKQHACPYRAQLLIAEVSQYHFLLRIKITYWISFLRNYRHGVWRQKVLHSNRASIEFAGFILRKESRN